MFLNKLLKYRQAKEGKNDSFNSSEIAESTLNQLSPGEQAEILDFACDGICENFLQRLLEVGFIKGEKLRVLSEAPFSRDPMSIRIKEATYALRREDALRIRVKRIR